MAHTHYEETSRVTRSRQAVGVRTIEEPSDHSAGSLFIQFARLAARTRLYEGRLAWGFNADSDAVPDLYDLADAVQRELAALEEVGAVVRAVPSALSLAGAA